MPELRSGVRRGGRVPPPLVVDREARRPRTRATAKKASDGAGSLVGWRRASVGKGKPASKGRPRGRPSKKAAAVARLIVTEDEGEGEGKVSDQVKEVVVVKELEQRGGVAAVDRRNLELLHEAQGKMMGDDSGGLSANRAAGQEEEGSTAPFPEKVDILTLLVFFYYLCLIGYII